MGSRSVFSLHLPRGLIVLQKTHARAIPPKKAGTTGTACKSLILKAKSCSVARTITKSPEQKTELSTGWASFTQTVNDRPSWLAKKLNDGSGVAESLFSVLAHTRLRPRARTSNWFQMVGAKKSPAERLGFGCYLVTSSFTLKAMIAASRAFMFAVGSLPRASADLQRVFNPSRVFSTNSPKDNVAARDTDSGLRCF